MTRTPLLLPVVRNVSRYRFPEYADSPCTYDDRRPSPPASSTRLEGTAMGLPIPPRITLASISAHHAVRSRDEENPPLYIWLSVAGRSREEEIPSLYICRAIGMGLPVALLPRWQESRRRESTSVHVWSFRDGATGTPPPSLAARVANGNYYVPK